MARMRGTPRYRVPCSPFRTMLGPDHHNQWDSDVLAACNA